MRHPMSMWTAERDLELRQWVGEGRSRTWIANHYTEQGLPCTRNMVVGRIYRVGITSSRQQGETNQRMTKLGRRLRVARTTHRLPKKPRISPTQELRLLEIGAPPPLNIPTTALTIFTCKAVVEGTNDDCIWQHCGHHTETAPWCDYHRARYTRRVRAA